MSCCATTRAAVACSRRIEVKTGRVKENMDHCKPACSSIIARTAVIAAALPSARDRTTYQSVRHDGAGMRSRALLFYQKSRLVIRPPRLLQQRHRRHPVRHRRRYDQALQFMVPCVPEHAHRVKRTARARCSPFHIEHPIESPIAPVQLPSAAPSYRPPESLVSVTSTGPLHKGGA